MILLYYSSRCNYNFQKDNENDNILTKEIGSGKGVVLSAVAISIHVVRDCFRVNESMQSAGFP